MLKTIGQLTLERDFLQDCFRQQGHPVPRAGFLKLISSPFSSRTISALSTIAFYSTSLSVNCSLFDAFPMERMDSDGPPFPSAWGGNDETQAVFRCETNPVAAAMIFLVGPNVKRNSNAAFPFALTQMGVRAYLRILENGIGKTLHGQF